MTTKFFASKWEITVIVPKTNSFPYEFILNTYAFGCTSHTLYRDRQEKSIAVSPSNSTTTHGSLSGVSMRVYKTHAWSIYGYAITGPDMRQRYIIQVSFVRLS